MSPGRRGEVRWRLRKRIKGRKVDVYLPGAYGSVEFRAAYEAAVNPQPVQKTVGAFGPFDQVITSYRGSKGFKGTAIYYRRGKTGQETDLPLKFMPNLVAELRQLPPGN